MFKFKGISSEDMQVVIEEEENFIARASKRYEITEIEGKDGAIFDELGYSVVERPMYVQCLNINKIDDILAWLDGEGEFEYKGRKTTARFYSQLDPQRSSCIRIMDTTFIRDPFWYKANEDFQLVKDRKDKKASGEYIHVEDSSNCRAKIGIGGNSEQETSTTGKNKFNLGEESYTRIGVNVIINKNKIILNGTTISSNNLFISGKLSAGYLYLGKFKAGTYRVTKFITSGKYEINSEIGEGTFATYIRKSDGTSLSNIVGDTENKTGSTITLTEDTDLYFQIWINSGAVFTNYVLEWQLEEGNSTTDLEQFVPNMPSLDYQSPVKTVGSNANLIEETFEGYNINANGAFEKANGYDMQIAKLKANIKYTLNADTYVFGYYNEKPTIASITYDKSRVVLPQSLNTIIPTRDGYISFRTDKTDNNKKIKLVEGTEVGEYSKYGQGCINEVICNKNLFNVSILNDYSQNGLTLIKNKGTNKIKLNGTPSADFTIYSKDFDINKLKIGSTYSLSKDFDNITFNFEVFENNSNTASVWKKSITMQKSYTRVRVYVQGKANTTFNNQEIALQLEKGNATEIVAHQSQTYIIPTQQEMLEGDYFDFDNEEEVHTWNKLVLNGTESIEKFQYSDNTFLIAKGAKNVNASEILVKSNMFMGVSYNNRTISRNYIIYVEIETGNIIFRNTSYSALADFKTWLKSQYDAGTPVTVYYKLATPTRLAFTDDQKAVAKELNNARTYKNVTNIYSTDETSPIIDLDYFIVTNETIKNEGNIQSRPILRLEKTVSEAVEITINDVRFKYSFSGDKYVDIDCENKTVEYEQLNRNRNLSIGYDFPKLNIGNNKIIMNDGDCILKVIRKDRWL